MIRPLFLRVLLAALENGFEQGGSWQGWKQGHPWGMLGAQTRLVVLGTEKQM